MPFLVVLAGCERQLEQNTQEDNIQLIRRPIYYHTPGGGKEPSAASVSAGIPQRPTTRYYCLVGTLNPPGTKWAYNYKAFNLHLPKGLLRQAHRSGRPDRWVVLGMTHQNAVQRHEADTLEGQGVVRLAQCRVPDVPGMAVKLKKQLVKFGPASWRAMAEPPSRQPSSAPGGDPKTSEGRCVQYTFYYFCVDVYSPGQRDEATTTCKLEKVVCTKYKFYADDPFADGGTGGSPPPAGGTGGSPAGDDANMCEPSSGSGGTGLTEPSSESGGTGLTDPDGVPLGCKPCDSANPPDYCNAELDNDFVEVSIDTTNLKCDGSYTGTPNERETKKAWCASSVPTDGRLQKTNDALDKIAKRGDDCAAIAQKGRKLLRQHGLRFYPDGAIGKGGKGGQSFGALLSDYWLTYIGNPEIVIDADGTKLKINFKFGLVHEIEHTMGRRHIYSKAIGGRVKWRTPHAVECSGL